MSDNSLIKPPVWFWIVSVIGLIWNAMGVDHYIGQAYNTERWRSQFTAEQLELAGNHPAWLTAAFAIAVFAGVLGCILLLLKKKLAYTLLLLSLVAVIVQMGYLLSQGHTDDLIMTIMVIVFSLFLVFFSKKAVANNWIG